MTSLHVLSSGAERILRQVDGAIPSTDRVLPLHYPLNVGPLHDFEHPSAERTAFWRDIDGGDEWQACWELDQRTAEELRATQVPVVVWHGPSAVEHLVALRATYLLRDSSVHLSECVRHASGRSMPRFYDAIAISSRSELASLAASRTPVLDRARRVALWESLTVSRTTMFRELVEGDVREFPAEAYDPRILSACSEGWGGVGLVIGRVLTKTYVSDAVIRWRLKHLVAGGLLETRGRGPFGPAEVRRVPEPGAVDR